MWVLSLELLKEFKGINRLILAVVFSGNERDARENASIFGKQIKETKPRKGT